MSVLSPVADGVNEVFTLNQLGNAHLSLHNYQEATQAYQKGLTLAPDNLALRTNLGTLLRETGRSAEARKTMEEGLQSCLSTQQREGEGEGKREGESGSIPCPPALLNNLGLLEMDAGRFAEALRLFEDALSQLQSPSFQQ